MTDKKILDALEGCQPPAWELIPDFGLYMDQVLTYVDKNLPGLSGFSALTAAMINNYVKAGMIDKPLGKKYSRDAVAQLMMVCLLKQSLPQDIIRRLLHGEEGQSTEEIYNAFRTSRQDSLESIRRRMEDLSCGKAVPGVLTLALESASLSMVTRLRFLEAEEESGC